MGITSFIPLNMAKVHSRKIPYLTPRQFEDGSGWHVEVYWIGRPMEAIGSLRRPLCAQRLDRPSLWLRELGPTIKHLALLIRLASSMFPLRRITMRRCRPDRLTEAAHFDAAPRRL
jgi:hypothetical protein